MLLKTGDIVMFPHGDAHVLSSAPGIRPTRLNPDWIYATRNDPKSIPVVFHTAAGIQLWNARAGIGEQCRVRFPGL